jgi:hypothetical protein
MVVIHIDIYSAVDHEFDGSDTYWYLQCGDMSLHTNTLSWFCVTQSIYALTSKCYVFIGEATDTNFIVYGLIPPGFELTIYRTVDINMYHYHRTHDLPVDLVLEQNDYINNSYYLTDDIETFNYIDCLLFNVKGTIFQLYL